MASFGMLIAALLPPPTPLRFLCAAGVFEVPLWELHVRHYACAPDSAISASAIGIRYGK